jgi:hypothetical protein
MRKSFLLLAGLLLSSAAFAQSTTNIQPGSNNPSSSQNSNSQNSSQQPTTSQIASQIRTNLERAGFKDIKLMPGSFIVRAQDQNNNPVMMVINPDSVTAISSVNNAQGTTGQGTGSGGGSSGNQPGANQPSTNQPSTNQPGTNQPNR